MKGRNYSPTCLYLYKPVEIYASHLDILLLKQSVFHSIAESATEKEFGERTRRVHE